MADETPNHNLNTYSEGDTNWTHSPDMEHIEERLQIRDTEEKLENYVPHSKATFIATDTGAVYDGDGSQWNKATRKLGDAEAETLRTEELRGIADHIITNREQLYEVFPETNSGTSVLDDADTVFIDPENPPIRHERDLYIDFNNANGVSIFGRYKFGEEYDLRPAEESEAQGFVVDSRGVTIEGISYNGDRVNQSHGNAMPFVRLKFAPDFRAGYNFASDLYPFQVHSGGGDMFHAVGGQSNLFGYFNRCDKPGDRMWSVFNWDGCLIYGDTITNGFDRGITFNGCNDAYAIGCRSSGNVEGSTFGVEDNGNNVENINFIGCVGRDNARAYCTIRSDGGGRIDDVDIVAPHGVQDTDNPDSNRFGIETVGAGANVDVFGGTLKNYTGGGVQNDFDDVTFWGTHFDSVDTLLSGGTTGDYWTTDGGSDFDARGITWSNVTTLADGWGSATRPRWDGVIGGGPFGGVDLSTVTGRQDGDRAIANGSSAASDDALALWDAGGSVWYYYDPTGTV